MSNITVYNKMGIDPRVINVKDKSSQNHPVAPGGNTPGLPFARGESVLIAMSNPSNELINGCWIAFPACCDYEFIQGKPQGLKEYTLGNNKLLSTPPHAPIWGLKITNRLCPPEIFTGDIRQEPNITVGDNQRLLLKLFEQGMTLERYVLGLTTEIERGEEEIEPLVIRVIAVISGYNTGDITPGMDLKIDLGLTAYQRKALAAPFLKIAKMYNPDAMITRGQCENLKTVQGAIDLVKKAAGF